MGDKICILYGCTVPVVLCETKKKEAQYNQDKALTAEAGIKIEAEEDSAEALKASIRRAVRNRERKGKYRSNKYKEEEWQVTMDAIQAYLEDKRSERDVKDGDIKRQAAKIREKEERKAFWMIRAEMINNAYKVQRHEEAKEKERAIMKEVEEMEERDDSPNRYHNSDDELSATGSATISDKVPTSKLSDAASSEKKIRKELLVRNQRRVLPAWNDGWRAMREKFYKGLEDYTFELR